MASKTTGQTWDVWNKQSTERIIMLLWRPAAGTRWYNRKNNIVAKLYGSDIETRETHRWKYHHGIITSAGSNTWRSRGEITCFICSLSTIKNCRETSMARSTIRRHSTVKKCTIRSGTFSNTWWSKFGLPTLEEQKSGHKPKVDTKLLALILRISEAWGSSLVPETFLRLFVIFLSPFRQLAG